MAAETEITGDARGRRAGAVGIRRLGLLLALAGCLGSCGGDVGILPPLRGGDAPAPSVFAQPAPSSSAANQKLAQLVSPLARPGRIPQQPRSARLAGWPDPGGVLPPGFLADRVVVFKAERRLYLLSGNRPVKGYDVALGFTPRGHKLQQGDGRTPEGRYFISDRNPNSSYHLSLRVSYPNDQDVAYARARGADPGGDIMIHGLPNSDSRGVARYHPGWDWTNGCVAVANAEISEIYDTVLVGTPIDILP